jgi:hypothetical protein
LKHEGYVEKQPAIPKQQAPSFEQALGVLRQFRGARSAAAQKLERCELCSADVFPGHPHLVELVSHQIVCACDPCALLFDGAERAKYKKVPREVRVLADFKLTEVQWESLFIPINLAFFFRSSIEGRMIALYPSPAGAVESLLSLESWNAIVECNPALREMRSDVEGLLANRVLRAGKAPSAEYYLAPIDECYRLVGVIRAHWKGLSGGDEVWAEVDGFFASLRARASVPIGGRDA